MNYFNELLDSYHNRGCCVSRIDERASKAEIQAKQQQRMSDMVNLIRQAANNPGQQMTSPGGTWSLTPKQDNTGFSLKTSIDSKPYSVDLNFNIQAAGSRLTRIQNFLLGKEQKAKAGDKKKQQQPQTAEERFPEVDLEKAREQAKIDAVNLEINDGIRTIVDQYDQEAICRARLNIGSLVDTFRPDRERPSKKPAQKAVQSEIQSKIEGKSSVYLSLTDVKLFHELVRDNYKELQNDTPGASCKFLSNLNKLIDNFRDESVRESLRSIFVFPEDLSQHVINLTSNNQNSITRSIDLAHDPKVATNIDFILQDRCSKEDEECVPPESLPEEQIAAIRENMKIIVNLAAKDEINDDEKALLQSLIQVTDTRKIALAGVNFSDSVILPDRGKAFLDLLKFIERKHDLKFDVLELDSRLTQEGAENTLIGTAFEYWHIFDNLLKLAQTATNSDEKRKLMTAATAYFNKLGNMCESLQALRSRLGAARKGPAIPTGEYQKILEFEKEMLGDCSDLSDMNRIMTNHVEKSTRNRNPDLMIQVGRETGKGLRADTVLGFYDKNSAQSAAKASGLNPKKAVVKTTVGELLARNPEYHNILNNAGVVGKGKRLDPTMIIYTIDEGLKTSSSKSTNAVTTGTSTIVSIGEDIQEGVSSPWVANVADSLGLEGANLDAAVKSAQSVFNKITKADQILEKSLRVVNVKGKKESTGNLTASQIMDALKAEHVDGLMIQKDELFRAAQAYAKEVNKKIEDPKKLKYAKEQLSKALKKRLLEQELTNKFNSSKASDRAGAALIVGMVGGVRNDQALQYADLVSGDQYIIDHNSIAVAPFMAAINNPNNKVTIKRARDSFSISIDCANGPRLTVRFTGLTGASSISKSVFSKGCGESGNAIKLESSQKTKLFGLLKSQLEILTEIFR